MTNFCTIDATVKFSSNTNADYISLDGFYIIGENSNLLGFPVPPNGVMYVENFGGGIVRQTYSEYSGRTWIRMCWYGNWQGWRQIA